MAKVCILRETSIQALEYFFKFEGKFIYSNGDIYEGAFRDGFKSGEGQGILCV